MASKRRGGIRPPELRGTLGTLLRTTTDVVRDAIERGAREGRARLDDVRASRRRQDALAELGEVVLDLIRRGEIDLAELPECRDVVRVLDDFDADPDDEPAAKSARPLARRRFDDRAAHRDDNRDDDDDEHRADAHSRRTLDEDRRPDARVRRATPERADDERRADTDRRSDLDRRPDADRRGERDTERRRPSDTDMRRTVDLRRAFGDWHRNDTRSDGTVSSGAAFRAMRPTMSGRPPHADSATSRAPTKPMKGHRPHTEPSRQVSADEERPRSEVTAAGTSPPLPAAATAFSEGEPKPERRRTFLPHDPQRRGGITFDDDDLNEYMHPDDVPSKTPTPEPGDTDP